MCAFYKEKALVGAFSEYFENFREVSLTALVLGPHEVQVVEAGEGDGDRGHEAGQRRGQARHVRRVRDPVVRTPVEEHLVIIIIIIIIIILITGTLTLDTS